MEKKKMSFLKPFWCPQGAEFEADGFSPPKSQAAECRPNANVPLLWNQRPSTGLGDSAASNG